ncbi:uncharacterized protein LOC121266788 [Juglans microcarpa x Juglans regia]|uniref:Uncharacterized protein n=2 Tax=Juglans regia TaxID=51240 RepID=A0A833XNQ0_JUGRE|nr:uncharacterized protein LOC108982778 [Juglans regia]XP_041026544.1 uncharacterized protein LOC121266788 [Juglans microcarpa x Juglans regia]KAF5473132.1 hypothetical protein F2P56_009770 [Juglans regia]
MVEEDGYAWAPIGAPLNDVQREEHWRHFDNSVNAVSFGFVATAILISMFLVMAIFERFLRPTSPALSPSSGHSHRDLEAQTGFNAKLGHPSPKMTVYTSGVSVLMPGDDIPTFIAHPAPMPCPPERCLWPNHQHISLPNLNSNSNLSTSSSSLGENET